MLKVIVADRYKSSNKQYQTTPGQTAIKQVFIAKMF